MFDALIAANDLFPSWSEISGQAKVERLLVLLIVVGLVFKLVAGIVWRVVLCAVLVVGLYFSLLAMGEIF